MSSGKIALHVETKIDLVTDGTRGVTLSQVIRTDDVNNNIPLAGDAYFTGDKNFPGIDNKSKAAITDGTLIKPEKVKDHKSHRSSSHRPSSTDKREKPKPPVRKLLREHKHTVPKELDGDNKESSVKLHGKPSSVKTRSSKKSSTHGSKKSSPKSSTKSITSQYSEPNPIVPGASSKDLAEMLLERLSGTSVSEESFRLSLMSLKDDDTVKSDTDRSFVKTVSKEAGTDKFTKNDGRPLDKEESGEFRVRFDPQSYLDRPADTDKRQSLGSHPPLSTQMYVANKYPQWSERKFVKPDEIEGKKPYQPFTLFVPPKANEENPSVISVYMKDKGETTETRGGQQRFRFVNQTDTTFRRNYYGPLPNNTTV